MPWSDFVQAMGGFALYDPAAWCSACQTVNLFCDGLALDDETSSGGSTSNNTISSGNGHAGKGKAGMSPVIAGVVGACATLAFVVLTALALLLFGFRLDYHGRKDGSAKAGVGGVGILKRSQSGGGFKGAEKLASDTDLRLKGGAGATIVRHERVGSWELGDSPSSPHASLDKEIGPVRGRRSEDAEEGLGNVNPFGNPVKAVDQV